MAVEVIFDDPRDAAHVVDALLAEADRQDAARPLLAARYRRIAEDVGDALDRLPRPSERLSQRGRRR